MGIDLGLSVPCRGFLPSRVLVPLAQARFAYTRRRAEGAARSHAKKPAASRQRADGTRLSPRDNVTRGETCSELEGMIYVCTSGLLAETDCPLLNGAEHLPVFSPRLYVGSPTKSKPQI